MSKQSEQNMSTDDKLLSALNENLILKAKCQQNEDHIAQLQQTLKANLKVISSGLKLALTNVDLEFGLKIANDHINDLYWNIDVIRFHAGFCPKSTDFFCAADEVREMLKCITETIEKGKIEWMKINN